MHAADRRQFLLASLTGAPAVFALTTRGAFGQQRTELSVAHSINTAVYATHMAAVETGYMREAGIDMRIITTGGGSRVRDIVAAGQVGFGLGDSTHPLQLTNRQRPARMLMATDTRCSYANIVVRADLFSQGIDSVEKLARWRRPDGAKPILACTAIGSGTWVYGNFILRAKGLANDVNWVAGGETQTMLGGLRSRQFDAIMAVPAWIFEAEDNGFGKTIYDVRHKAQWDEVFRRDFPATVAYALDEYTQRSGELTQNYISAMYRTQKWLIAQPVAEIVRLLWRSQMPSLPEETVRRETEYYKTIFHQSGRVSTEEYAASEPVSFNEDTRIRPIPYERAVDMRFLEEAVRRHG